MHGIRRYGAEDLRRLRFIRQAQSAGFTLEEIRELIDLDASQDRARARELAAARIEALGRKIAELEAGARGAPPSRRRMRLGQSGPLSDPDVVRSVKRRGR